MSFLENFTKMAPIQLSKFIVPECYFDRMKHEHESCSDYRGLYTDMSYDEFVSWNIKCINELSNEDIVWLSGLCKRIKENIIILQDMESCVRFTADSFFFDCSKKIVIVNPR